MILKYPQIIHKFYLNHYNEIVIIAKKIISNYYNLSITYDDLISLFYLKIMDIDTQTEYYKNKQNIEQFIFSRIKYYMLNICKKYIPKKSLDFIPISEINEVSCKNNYYEYNNKEDLFSELSSMEFDILYAKNIKKQTIKQLSKKYNICINEINLILMQSLIKVKKNKK